VDTFTPGPFPLPSDDPIERAIAEIDAAIELVLDGAATRVTLTALPGLADAAGAGAARAQAASVGFRLAPGEPDTVVIGPRRPTFAPDSGNDPT
jgi:hypothetical protein